MTREVIKELLPIFHAFAEGKTIQCCDRDKPDDWWDIQCKDPCFDLDLFEYRVKSIENKDKHYRQFKDYDELRNNYRYDSIWVKSKYDSNVQLMITGYIIADEGISYVWLTDSWISLEKLFDDWVFVNDMPCGVEE